MASTSPKVLECCAQKEKIKSAMKRSSRCVAEQFREVVLYRPMIQNVKMLKAKAERSLWVQLERVNPRYFPTHSARESEWAKVEAVLKSDNSVFKRNRVDSG
ncbi:hypothetical protein H5410_040327 [Solanum commersonii]|uniref:Uncharacterized protein n=1 Tax=Solanum commersonii TaxID=4109 RepID=A0A9J5XPT0_SOLCO|nr:hypothetical protein H5410_040327 [Solanum commersonii]